MAIYITEKEAIYITDNRRYALQKKGIYITVNGDIHYRKWRYTLQKKEYT